MDWGGPVHLPSARQVLSAFNKELHLGPEIHKYPLKEGLEFRAPFKRFGVDIRQV